MEWEVGHLTARSTPRRFWVMDQGYGSGEKVNLHLSAFLPRWTFTCRQKKRRKKRERNKENLTLTTQGHMDGGNMQYLSLFSTFMFFLSSHVKEKNRKSCQKKKKIKPLSTPGARGYGQEWESFMSVLRKTFNCFWYKLLFWFTIGLIFGFTIG